MPRTLLSLALLAAACATPARKMTFAEAGLVGPQEAPPEVAEGTPRPEEGGPPAEGGKASPERPASPGAGAPLDATLVRFALAARARRAALAAEASFPSQAVEAWRDLVAALHSGLAEPAPLAVISRAQVTLETELELDRRQFGSPPAELHREIEGELAHLEARAALARAQGDSPFSATRPPALAWPLEDADVTSPFGERLHPIDHVPRMHQGIDLAAAPGRVVRAAADGYVVEAGPRAGYGLAVLLRHAGELSSRYAHLSHLLCAPGDRVLAGAPLGLVGSTGRSTGPHLHFEVWRGGRAEDPLALLLAHQATGRP